jgi:hypothetical protein
MHVERHRYRPGKLVHEGRIVGEVVKYTRESGFRVSLRGIYWRRGEPTRRGGSSGTSVRRMMDAVAIAEKAIPLLQPNP